MLVSRYLQLIRLTGNLGKFWVVTLLHLTTSIVELGSVVAFMTFLAVLGGWQPAVGLGEPLYLKSGLLALAMIVLSRAMALGCAWVRHGHLRETETRLLKMLLSKHLYRPFLEVLKLDKPQALTDVHNLAASLLIPVVSSLEFLFGPLLIALLVLLYDPVLAFWSFLVVGLLYALMHTVLKSFQLRWGWRVDRAGRIRSQLFSEALLGIDAIKVAEREAHFVDRFDEVSKEVTSTSRLQVFTEELPRHFMDVLSLGGIVVLSMAVYSTGNTARLLPTLGLYTFAAFRIVPALHVLTGNLGRLRFGLPYLERVLEAIDSSEQSADRHRAPQLTQELRLENVDFTYPGRELPALKGIDLTIHHGESVGLVGGSGTGKSTLVRILLGLLSPDRGQISIDGQPCQLTKLAAWRGERIGYVPQEVFLFGDTVAANVALGVAPEDIDRQAVERACRQASIHDFIVNELESGYETSLEGQQLSGGQRQRLGIARALYHQPALLVLDEATSALDGETEAALCETIFSLGEQVSLVVVSHRLSFVEHCDQVYVLEAGHVLTRGTMSDLLDSCEPLARMAKAQALRV